jgi:hypothetical protein
MRPGFYLSVFLELVCCSLLVFSTIMANNPAPKRARRAIDTVCEACGKHFDTSDGFDKHRTSGYLVGTPCHVLDDGSTCAQLVATSRQTMSTAMLQKLKLARRTDGTASKILSRMSTSPKNISNLSKKSIYKCTKTKPGGVGLPTPPVLVLAHLKMLILLIFRGMCLSYLGFLDGYYLANTYGEVIFFRLIRIT